MPTNSLYCAIVETKQAMQMRLKTGTISVISTLQLTLETFQIKSIEKVEPNCYFTLGHFNTRNRLLVN